jgi:outer membrane protein assembly factor BamB
MKLLISLKIKPVLFALQLIISLSGFFLCQGQSVTLKRPLTLRWNYISDELTAITLAKDQKDQEAIYASLQGGAIVSLRSEDGQLTWKTDVGGDVLVTSVADSQNIYVASETNRLKIQTVQNADDYSGYVRALSRSSGVTRWLCKLPQPVHTGLVANETSIFADSTDGKVYAINKKTGELLWITQLPGHVSSPLVIDEKTLYAGTDTGYLLSLDQTTGRITWRYRTRRVLCAIKSTSNNSLYFGTPDGFVNALSEKDGELALLWRRRVGTGIQSISQTSNGILVTTQDNFVMLLEFQKGKNVWKKQMPARLAPQPLLTYDTGLFAPIGEDVCIALSLRDGKQVNTLFIGEDNSVVASPILANDVLLIPTRIGLLAFAASK